MAQSRRSWFILLCRIVAVTLGAFVIGWILMAPNAGAIPYFARKYETACSTCHNNFPELNDFGEAFKKNGWKFPKDEETYVKQPPVLLGAPAQRQVFPKAVYPGELPSTFQFRSAIAGSLVQQQAAFEHNAEPGISAKDGFVYTQHVYCHSGRYLRRHSLLLG